MKTKTWNETIGYINAEFALKIEPASYEAGYLALLLSLLYMRHHTQEQELTTRLVERLCQATTSTKLPSLFDRLNLSEDDGFGWLDGYAKGETAKLVSPEALLFSLVGAIPRGMSSQSPAWAFVDQIAKSLDYDLALNDMFKAYLDGSADEDAARGPAALLALLRADKRLVIMFEHLQMNGSRRDEPAGALDLETLKRILSSRVEELRPTISAVFGGDPSHQRKLDELISYLESDTFRVAVLGEFKRGKSTLINALVGEPDLMPADTLPCTSALTEIRGNRTRSFMRQEGSITSAYIPSDEVEFRERAGAAATRQPSRRDGDENERAADSIPRWRVTIPSGFLQRGAISVIDTPGLREDHVRDVLAKREALRADAAIVVMNATQLASSDELELIEDMKLKANNIIVVINKIDLVPKSEWPRLKRHALARIGEKTEAISEERILLLSAGKAEDALKTGEGGQDWLAGLDELREMIVEHLVQQRGNDKINLIKKKIERLVTEYNDHAQSMLVNAEQRLKTFRDTEESAADAKSALDSARKAVDHAADILKESRGARDALTGEYNSNMSVFFEALTEHSKGWDSKHSPITSPKKFTEDIAKLAQNSLIDIIQEWSSGEAVKIVEVEINAKFNEAIKKVNDLIQYIHNATGRSRDSIIKQITSQTFHIDSDAFSTESSSVGAVMLHGVLSAVVGYIIADIILYYVLGLISGFLNPILLAAGVIGGLIMAVVGQDALKNKIKKKIIEEIRSKLNENSVKAKIHRAINQSVDEVFHNISRDFKESCDDLIEEAMIQEALAQERLKRFLDERGFIDKDQYYAALMDEREQAELLANELQKLVHVFGPRLALTSGR